MASLSGKPKFRPVKIMNMHCQRLDWLAIKFAVLTRTLYWHIILLRWTGKGIWSAIWLAHPQCDAAVECPEHWPPAVSIQCVYTFFFLIYFRYHIYANAHTSFIKRLKFIWRVHCWFHRSVWWMFAETGHSKSRPLFFIVVPLPDSGIPPRQLRLRRIFRRTFTLSAWPGGRTCSCARLMMSR